MKSLLAILGLVLLAGTAHAQPYSRIVSLSPHITELLFAAGAGDRIVGAGAYSDFPEAAKSIPRVGDVAALDVERLLALRPDLVIFWSSGTPLRQQQQLKALGLHLYATEQRTFADIESALRDFGRLAGTEATADEAATQLHTMLDRLRNRYASRSRLRVFYQVWDHPLYTLTRRHVVNEALELCGGDNVFADVTGLAPTVDIESVLARNPDVILIGAIGPDGDRQSRAWNRYGTLRAVHLQQIYTVDPSLVNRMTSRIVFGVEEICARLDQARLRSLPRSASVSNAPRK